MANLYQDSKPALERLLLHEHGLILTESELFDVWVVATAECRREIRRLERLVQFQMNGRTQDAEERNEVIQNLTMQAANTETKGNK